MSPSLWYKEVHQVHLLVLVEIERATTDTNTPLVLMQLALCGGGCIWWCKVYTVQIVDYWKPTVHSIPTGSDRKFIFIKLCLVCLVLNWCHLVSSLHFIHNKVQMQMLTTNGGTLLL